MNNITFRMLITEKEKEVYTSCIKLTNQEINNQNPIDTVEMGLTLTKIDILIEEIDTVRDDPINQNDLYNIIERGDEGNPMQNGAAWRARVMKLTKDLFREILQSSRIPENYLKHKKVLQNIIKENKWTEKMEFIAIGWVESNDQHVWVHSKMTKRVGFNWEAKMEIFQTKTRIANECKKRTKLGKKIYLFKN